MAITIHKKEGYEYVDEGSGPTLVLLHGLFGALSNWAEVVKTFSSSFRVVIPLMPIYIKTDVEPSVRGLVDYVIEFLAFMKLEKYALLGNSLGGHIGLIATLENQEEVTALVLTGSSGLFESGMGSTFPKRGDYEYVKERVEYTFYDPEKATKELIDEVFSITNDNYKALRVLRIARAAQRENLSKKIHKIQVPTLLIWGLNDNITPPQVAHEFNLLLPKAELRFIDNCGHAPMMERPQAFNEVLNSFLIKQKHAIGIN